MQNIDIKDYEHNDLIKYGKLVTFEMTMKPYEDERKRTIRVLLPEGYDEKKKFPVFYMHDAQMLFDDGGEWPKWKLDREMKKLHDKGIDAVIVAIDTNMTHRGSELCPNYPPTKAHFMLRDAPPSGDTYAKFLIDELMPVVKGNFAVLTDRENTGVGGASMGGMISHYIALKYPELFSKCMVFSPAYSFIEWDTMAEDFKNYNYSRLDGIRFYILSGGNEVERNLKTLDSSVKCYEHLMANSVDEEHVILVTDSRLLHHESSWSKMFEDAFSYLYG